MKMILAVVQADDATAVVQAINQAGYRATRIATEGGWLRHENVTLLIGVEGSEVNRVLEILRRTSQRRTTYINVTAEVTGMFSMQPIEVEVGGATVFVLDVERFERLV